jgi:hypothetical protein
MDIIARLNAAAVEARASEINQRRFAQLGLAVLPLDQQTPEGFRTFQKAETGENRCGMSRGPWLTDIESVFRLACVSGAI